MGGCAISRFIMEKTAILQKFLVSHTWNKARKNMFFENNVIKNWKFVFHFLFTWKYSVSLFFWGTVRKNRFRELGERSKTISEMWNIALFACFGSLANQNSNMLKIWDTFVSFSKLREPNLANSSAKWRAHRVLLRGRKTKLKFPIFGHIIFKKHIFTSLISRVPNKEFRQNGRFFHEESRYGTSTHLASVHKVLKWLCANFETNLGNKVVSPAIQTKNTVPALLI